MSYIQNHGYASNPYIQFVDEDGKPLSAGTLTTYIAGTTTPVTTYKDWNQTLNPSTITLDINGGCTIILNQALRYKFEIRESDGSLFKTFDNIEAYNSGGNQIINQQVVVEVAEGTGIDVTASTQDDLTKYTISIDDSIVVTHTKLESELQQLITDTKEYVNESIEKANEIQDIHTKEYIDGEIDKLESSVNSSLAGKKNLQEPVDQSGSVTKTITRIQQDEQGKINVTYSDIPLSNNVTIESSDNSINITDDGQCNFNLTLPSDVVRDSNYVHIEGATEAPLTDGIASVGISTKYAREDHVHPSDTSKEDIANKTTDVLGTSDSKYPTDKAVAEFVNSTIATNTATYISNNGGPFTSVEQLNAYTGAVTNNDYAFVTGIDSEGNAYYDRYKATVNDSSVTWSLEYRLNNSSFTAAQWSAINSGITSVLVAKIHDHGNKDVLDGITSDDVGSWNSKMDRQTVGGATEPVYLENGIAKVATGVATKDDLNTKQNTLTAGENISIDGDTISSNQVFVAAYGTTTYQEIKDAYDAGKICICKNIKLIGTLYAINDSVIRFQYTKPDQGCIVSYSVSKNNIWTSNELSIQSRLKFDTTPAEGSSNPVTSDGIKKAIDAVNADIVDLSQSVDDVKDDLNNLAATAGSHATQIGQLQTDVESIESSLANKKDRQTELNFGGSVTKTVKSITQDANGVINVEYENIDFVRGDSNVEIKSEDNSVNVVESTDSQTNTKTYDLSVADSVKSKIKDITISNDTLVIIGD